MKLKGLEFYPKKTFYRQLFYFLMTVFGVSFFLVLLISGGYSMRGLLAPDRNNSLMEFFNKMILSGGDPYSSGSTAMPFALLVYRFLFGFVSPEAVSKLIPSRVSSEYTPNVKIYQQFNFPFILYSVFSLSLLYFALRALKKGSRGERFGFILITFLSAPLLFAFERGSDVVLTLGLVIFFFAGKDSENQNLRTLSVFALGAACAFSFYPLLFCLLLLRKKRFGDAVKTVLVCLVLTVPALAVAGGGFGGAGRLVSNIIAAGNERRLALLGQLNFSGCAVNVFAGTSMKNETLVIIGRIFGLSVGAAALFGAAVAKKEWQCVTLLCGLIFGLTPFCETYMLALFAIPLILLIDGEDANSVFSYVSLILLTLTQALIVSPDISARSYTRMFITRLTSYGALALVLMTAIYSIAVFIKDLRCSFLRRRNLS